MPTAIREQCWLNSFGEVYKSKCYIHWCANTIDVYNYHIGHDLPASKGGTDNIDNLKPICARCNYSMSNNYTIQEWHEIFKPKRSCLVRMYHKYCRQLFKR
jgi:hypothetical protein